MKGNRYLYNYALRQLGGRRHTVAEMRKKLHAKAQKMSATGHGTAPAADTATAETAIEEIITRLKGYKFLDDDEYATLYIRDHLQRKPQGVMMLKMRMTAKGLQKEVIERALATAGIDETAQARKAVAKKMKTMRPARDESRSAQNKSQPTHKSHHSAQTSRLSALKQREKLTRFLASRGFGSRAISGALKSFPSDEGEDYLSP
jgi:regulatory protein